MTAKFVSQQLRDNLGHASIASYYIKTVFLWETDAQNAAFWNENSLAYVFMHVRIYSVKNCKDLVCVLPRC